jgi:hypothetical protein
MALIEIGRVTAEDPLNGVYDFLWAWKGVGQAMGELL